MTRHKRIILLISLAIVVLLALPINVIPALAQDNIVIVDTGRVNIRSGPAANTVPLGSVPGGTELIVTGRSLDGYWWRVVSPFGVGWVNSQFVAFRGAIDTVAIVSEPVGTLETPTVIVDEYPATVYRNPTRDSFVVGIAPTGTILTVLGRSMDGSWWQIETGGLGTGFVHIEDVAFRGDVTLVDYVADPGPTFDGPTIRVNSAANVVTQPGAGGTVIGSLPVGSTLPASGRTADNSWWQVAGDFGVGWIPVSNVSLAGSAANIRITTNLMTPGPAPTGAAAATILVEAERKVAYKEDSFASPPMWDARLGEQGTVIARSMDGLWLQVVFRNYIGWMHFSGITLQGAMAVIPVLDTTPPPVQNVAIVNTHWLNVRSGPGIEYERVGAAPGGASLRVTGRHPSLPWLRVEGDDFGVGWVRILYIVFRGNWTEVPEVTEPVGDIETPITIVYLDTQVYSQPDLAYPAGTIPPGEYAIVGRTRDYKWALIQATSGTVWLPYDELVLRGVEALIPVVQ